MSEKERNRQETIEAALIGGIVGGALGAIVTGESKKTVIAALVGAAAWASWNAFKRAKETGIPLIYEEDGVIYKEFSDGTKEIIKKIPRHKETIPSSFTLG